MRFHCIRDLFRTQKLSVEYVTSAEQDADILTKALGRANFQCHRKRLVNRWENGISALGRLFQAVNVPARHPRQVGLGLS